ncbi:helix-turn-helix domain-containing protein, partial [Xenorhabdus bovienii]|nr:helix-turn-helix domain-containing protein [Xenorhabdus bovienii]
MNTTEDWHSAEIIAALRKIGTSIGELSRESGLKHSTLSNALSRGWPKGEWIIAQRLNLHPSQIWPSRYFDCYGNLKERLPRQVSQWAENESVNIPLNHNQANNITEGYTFKGLSLLREELNFPPRVIAEAMGIPLSSIIQIEQLGQD